MASRFEWVLVSIVVGIGGVAACSSSESRGESQFGNGSAVGASERGSAASPTDDAGGGCGAPGQACCGDPDAGTGTCNTGALCHSSWNPVCVACGGRGQLCCGSEYHSEDGYCTEPGTECDLEGMFECKAPKDVCGSTQQKCCTSDVSDYPCDAVWEQCQPGYGRCTECGSYGQLCCRPYGPNLSRAPAHCMDGSTCGSLGTCGAP